jgi:hypothetical protein
MKDSTAQCNATQRNTMQVSRKDAAISWYVWLDAVIAAGFQVRFGSVPPQQNILVFPFDWNSFERINQKYQSIHQL